MKTKWIIILVVVAISGILAGLYFQFVYPYLPKYDWRQSFSIDSDNPYGMKFFYNDLKESNKGSFKVVYKKLSDELPLNSSKSNTYFYFGYEHFTDSSEVAHLLDFVRNGNTAFVSTYILPSSILENLISEPLEYNSSVADEFVSAMDEDYNAIEGFEINSPLYVVDTMVTISVKNSRGERNSGKFSHRQYKKDKQYRWAIYPTELVGHFSGYKNYRIISTLNDSTVNGFKISLGDGWLILHSSPELFTNFNYAKENGFKNAQFVLDNISGDEIYWDEGSKSFSGDNQYDGRENYSPSDSPLKYVFSQRSLTLSYYTLLFMLFLFVVFGIKRKQRPIPIIPPTRNTTLDYVDALAALYKNSKNHSFIAQEMWKIFVNFIRVKYGIALLNKDNDEEVNFMAKRSGIEASLINQLVSRANIACYGGGDNPQNIVDFQESLNYFYKNCK